MLLQSAISVAVFSRDFVLLLLGDVEHIFAGPQLSHLVQILAWPCSRVRQGYTYLLLILVPYTLSAIVRYSLREVENESFKAAKFQCP